MTFLSDKHVLLLTKWFSDIAQQYCYSEQDKYVLSSLMFCFDFTFLDTLSFIVNLLRPKPVNNGSDDTAMSPITDSKLTTVLSLAVSSVH